MPIPRPTTADAPAMLEPDGWPGIEEDLVSDLAVMLRRTCAQLEDVGEACWEAGALFEDGRWQGPAGAAAAVRFEEILEQMRSVLAALALVTDWHFDVCESATEVKEDIFAGVLSTQALIEATREAQPEAVPPLIAAQHVSNILKVSGLGLHIGADGTVPLAEI